MALLNDITPQMLVLRALAYLVFCGWHGLMLAGIARLLGDRTPGFDGRLTADPFAHLAPSGLFMAALFGIGWIRPMRLDPAAMRGGRLGLAACALGALAASLVLVFALNALRPLLASSLSGTAGYTAVLLAQQVQEVTIASTVFNLLPVPMLTGNLLAVAAFPAAARRMRKLEPLCAGLLVAALIAGAVPDVLPALRPLLLRGV
jgi:hypothetical protein